jgi:pyridoxamine 5'-phosphate oxidase
MHQFTLWFKEAEESSTIDEVNAMTLSTVDASGMPRGRVVLLKEIGQEGFIFYTNYDSEKGQAIAINNKVCVSFFWPGLERQIIIKGEAIKISEEKSTAYFSKRPRESQLGALVSDQSTSIKDRATLEKRLAVLDKTYEDKSIPKPETWGGYLICPMEFEFWQGRPSRLHDRIRYAKNNDIWTIERLQP